MFPAAVPKKRIALFFAVLVFGFTLLNLPFFLVNLKVFVTRHEAAPSAPVTESVAPLLTRADALLIPSLSLEAPVIYIDEKGEAAYQNALAHGVVHYPGTALPGEYGNVYIFGHSSDVPWSKGDYKTIFAPLPQIQNGDLIYFTDHAGQEFIYEVTQTQIVSPKDLSVLDQHENKERLLTLQTSYPIGTALERFIVVARLLED
jgi:LPXTG-site transpeptidase (sortase) family protein